MSDKWVLVPLRQSQEQYDALSNTNIMWRDNNSKRVYETQVAARPPIPPDVWKQMVGRMVDVVHEEVGMPTDETDDALLAACLRAALGISDE